MFSPELQGQLAKEWIAQERSAQARPLPEAGRPAPSIRQAIGRRFIAIGDWLASEPSLESGRSR